MAWKFWTNFKGAFKIAVGKIYKNGLWVAAPGKVRIGSSWTTFAGTATTPNYSYRDPMFKYKWGWKCICDTYGEYSGVAEVYTRCYNARKYGVSVSNYYYVKYGTNTLMTTGSTAKMTIGASTILGISYGGTDVRGLYIDVDDTGTSKDQDKFAMCCVYGDFPELLQRWKFGEFESNYLNYNSGGKMILPYYSVAAQQQHSAWCEAGFEAIRKLVKQYHNIDFNPAPYWVNNKYYTADLKNKISKVIHDYIVTHSRYGANATPNKGDLEAWPVYSNYTEDPVCASYACAYASMAWQWGITAMMVVGQCNYDQNAGTSNGYHQWNLVTYSPITFQDNWNQPSLWYEIDCTWDDPVLYSGGNTDSKGIGDTYCNFYNFNTTTAQMNSNGTRKRLVFGETTAAAYVSKYPVEGTGTTYNKYRSWTNYNNSTSKLYIA